MPGLKIRHLHQFTDDIMSVEYINNDKSSQGRMDMVAFLHKDSHAFMLNICRIKKKAQIIKNLSEREFKKG